MAQSSEQFKKCHPSGLRKLKMPQCHTISGVEGRVGVLVIRGLDGKPAEAFCHPYFKCAVSIRASIKDLTGDL